jgi:hypothetical protein
MKLLCAISLFLFTYSPGILAAAQTAPKPGDVTDNPQQYVLSRANSPERGLSQFDCSQCSAMKDLLFVAPVETCGNAGCDFYVFRKSPGKSYEYLTEVQLQRGGFQFLETTHNGLNDILIYHHMSAEEGQLLHMEFDGQNYQFAGVSETVESAEYASRINPEVVQQLFYSAEDVSGAGSRVPTKAVNSRELTLISPDDPQFETLLNANFPGLENLVGYQGMRPYLVLLRNDTPYAVSALTVEWDLQKETSYQLRTRNVFIQKHFEPARETQPFVPGELRLLASNSINVSSTEYARTRGAGAIAFFLSHGPPPVKNAHVVASIDAVIYADGKYVGPDRNHLLERFRAERDAEREEGASVLRVLSSNPTSSDILAALQPNQQPGFTLNGSPTNDPGLLYTRELAFNIFQDSQSLLSVYRRGGIGALSARAAAMANYPQETVSPLPTN